MKAESILALRPLPGCSGFSPSHMNTSLEESDDQSYVREYAA